jgi:hypothetical protein
MPSPKLEILVPSWPAQKAEAQYGAHNFGGTGTCDSTKILFRARDLNDSNWVSDAARAYQDICLYIWFDKDNAFSIDFRLCDIHTLQLKDAEDRIKILKNFIKKATAKNIRIGDFYRDFTEADIKELLIDVLQALGVKRTIQYNGIGVKETYASFYSVVEKVAEDIIKRRSNLKGF